MIMAVAKEAWRKKNPDLNGTRTHAFAISLHCSAIWASKPSVIWSVASSYYIYITYSEWMIVK